MYALRHCQPRHSARYFGLRGPEWLPGQVAKKFDCTVFDLIFFNSKIYPELAAGSKLKTGTQLQVTPTLAQVL